MAWTLESGIKNFDKPPGKPAKNFGEVAAKVVGASRTAKAAKMKAPPASAKRAAGQAQRKNTLAVRKGK
jgi:hypothetical protein